MNSTHQKPKQDHSQLFSNFTICVILLVIFLVLFIFLIVYLRVQRNKKKVINTSRTLIPVIFVANNGLCLRQSGGKIKCIESKNRKNSQDYHELQYNFSICDIDLSNFPIFSEDDIPNYKGLDTNFFRTDS